MRNDKMKHKRVLLASKSHRCFLSGSYKDDRQFFLKKSNSKIPCNFQFHQQMTLVISVIFFLFFFLNSMSRKFFKAAVLRIKVQAK